MKQFILAAAMLAFVTTPVLARDNVHVSGSSTVLPYATIVAEAFGENYSFQTPVVEGGGSGAGRKKLCEGVGEDTIDIANSSSKMKDSEYEDCAANGVTDVKEVRFGYDGIVFASDINGAAFNLTAKDIYLALTASSTATKWSDVNASLPDQEILVMIPGTKHGTREVFDVKVLEEGCKQVLGVEKLDDDQKKACIEVRTDGKAVDVDGDYTETLARLAADNKAVGVFGLSFYENNMDKLQVATIGGVVPSVETISAGDYPISRPLFFYVKMQHLDIIPGLKEYVQFFLSDQMAGPDGALVEYGLVPDPELAATQAEWQ
jgi:phosphate transport system substrate-binding protein